MKTRWLSTPSIRIQSGRKCIAVPAGHAFIGVTGFFVRDVQLPVGAAVAVRFCRGQEEIFVRGTVSACYPDLGLCVEFDERSGQAVRKLVALQETER